MTPPTSLEIAVDVVVGMAALAAAPALAVWSPSARGRAAVIAAGLLHIVVTVAAAVALVGAVGALVPGDPIARALGEDAPEEARAALAARLGLIDDVPAVVRPLFAGGRVVTGLATGELTSLRGEPVWPLLWPRLASSAKLGALGLVVGVAAGIALGLLAASAGRRGSRRPGVVGEVAGVVIVFFAAVPRVVLGPALLVLVAVRHGLLPAGGDEVPAAILLPALCLAVPFAGVVGRHVRVAAEDALAMPFVAAARSRGASMGRVAVVHVLPHALLPVVSLTGLQAGAILSGAVVVERVFSWPGVGTMLVERLQRGDLPVVVAIVAVAVTAVVVANTAARAVAVVVDPRLRSAGLRRGGR